MTASPLPALPWARLRRSIGVTAALFLVSFAGLCGDDDDGGTGPSADCIDEIDFAEMFFEEDDVQTINVGGSRSGSVTTSDVEVFFGDFGPYYYDIYVFAVEDGGTHTISVNPSGSFDADLTLASAAGVELEYEDDEVDPEATETIERSLAEGCYLIGVSSPIEEMTGSYSLTVEN